MKTIALAGYSAAVLLTSVQSGVSPASAAVDDALVLKAVVEHTVLPEVRRASSGTNPAPVVLIADRSIPLCKNNPGSDKPCRISDHWQRFLMPNPEGTWPGLIDNEQRRRLLVESLEARNAVPQALPAIEHPAVILIPADRSEEARQQYREQTVGFSSLSLPSYSPDGYALMYGSYTCGNLCGYGWLFVLQKLEGQWRVQSATVTVIS